MSLLPPPPLFAGAGGAATVAVGAPLDCLSASHDSSTCTEPAGEEEELSQRRWLHRSEYRSDGAAAVHRRFL